MIPGKNEQNPPLQDEGRDKQDQPAPQEFEYETPHTNPHEKGSKRP